MGLKETQTIMFLPFLRIINNGVTFDLNLEGTEGV